MSEKLCLKWTDFQENTNTAFGNLRNDSDFIDVTLACKDGQQIEAHKVILAASSPFFQKLLRTNKHKHPLILMRGVNAEDLVAIVDFLYYGEVSVNQENLDAFLAIAEDLELKGLTRNHEHQTSEDIKPRTNFVPGNKESKIYKTGEIKSYHNTSPNKQEVSETAVAVQNYEVCNVDISDVVELDEKVKSMMTKSQNSIPNGSTGMKKADICTVCGKEGLGTNIRNHIEANHLAGVSIPCNFCEKMFRTRKSLVRHPCAQTLEN